MRIHILQDFLYKRDIDLALLQEVTNPKITTIRRYTPYMNMGMEGCGTTILVKDCYLLSNN